MRLIYHPDAEVELIEAAQFYKCRVSTLGGQFLDATDHAIAIILAAPDRWSIIEEDVRHYLMPRFPFAIYFASIPTTSAFWHSSTTAVTRITGVTVSPNRPKVDSDREPGSV